MQAVLSRRDVITAAMLVSACLGLSPARSGAEGTKPIQSPITGNEDLGDLSQPQQALTQFYRAFNTRDLKMIDDNFAQSDDVAIDNPLGAIRRGADEPHKMYEGVFKTPADVHVEFGITPFTVLGTYFGPSVGSAARIVSVNRLSKLTHYRRPILTRPAEQAASKRAP